MSDDLNNSYETIKTEQISKFLDEKTHISETQIKEFYNKYLDFFKWTTTIALAAIFWEGVNHQYFINVLYFQISLASFFLAVVSSIVFTIKILKFVYDDLELNLLHIDSLKSTLFKDVNDRALFKKQNEVDKRISKKEPKQLCIVNWIFWLAIIHGLFLLGGMFFFLLGIW
jgi:hypothetical protein